MKVKYSKLFNLGGYENETCGVEQDFPEGTNYSLAMTVLLEMVNRDHEIRVKIREVKGRIETLEHHMGNAKNGDYDFGPKPSPDEFLSTVRRYETEIAKEEEELEKLEAQLYPHEPEAVLRAREILNKHEREAQAGEPHDSL